MPEAIKKFLFRIYVGIVRAVFKLIPQPKPLTLVGPGTAARLGSMMRDFAWNKPLIVTDKVLLELGILDSLKQGLEEAGLEYVIYDGVLPDPTFAIVDEATALLRQNQCDSVIAVGGGSAMDAAKVVKEAATHNKSTRKFTGMFKFSNAGLPFVAIPTTAGTGSEVTIAAVISDSVTHEKSTVIDPRLVPNVAVLDAELHRKLPPPITAATALDAMTHAVEAYTGTFKTPETDAYAVAAIKLILEYAEEAYKDGDRVEVREPLLLASYYAGFAITKAFVGYVHAIAHRFGAVYETPHGLANALVLPHVTEYNMDAIPELLAELAVATGLGSESEDTGVLARKFVDRLFELNRNLGVPESLDKLRREDIPAIAKGALKEATFTPFPVPKYMNQQQCEAIVAKVLPSA